MPKKIKLIGFFDISENNTKLINFNKPDYTVRREKAKIKKVEKNIFFRKQKPLIPIFSPLENDMFCNDFSPCQLETDSKQLHISNETPKDIEISFSNVITPSENSTYSLSPISEGNQNEKRLYNLDSQFINIFEETNLLEFIESDNTSEEMIESYFQCDLF